MSNTKNSILGRILEALNKKLDVDYKETYQEITNARTFSFSKITDNEENTKICLKNTECEFPVLNKSGKDTTSLGIDFKNKQDKLMGGFYRNDVIKDDLKKQETFMSCVSGNNKKTFLGVGFEGENAEKEVVITTPEIKNNIVSWGIPNYSAAIEIQARKEIIAPTNGWLFGWSTAAGSTETFFEINGVKIDIGGQYVSNYTENQWQFPILKGTKYKLKPSGSYKLYFFPNI